VDRVAAGCECVAYDWQRIAIELSEDEMRLCRDRGRQRQSYAEQRGFQAYGFASAELHTRGYLGECAFAKYLGIPVPSDWTWEGDRRRGHDVGGYQVRTAYSASGRLLIRPTDKPGNYVLLLTHDRPVIWLVGWCTLDWANEVGEPGVTPGGSPKPCKYVAQRALIPFPNIRGSFILQEDRYVQAA